LIHGSNRIRIKRSVLMSPGIHLRGLQRELGISFNSVRYHVDRLARAGEIVRTDHGGYSRLYPPGTRESEQHVFATLQSETDRIILTILLAHEDLSNSGLSELTKLAKSTISEHVATLVRLGIIRTGLGSKNGQAYKLVHPERVRTLLRELDSSLLRKAADRFTELWDF